ncbi:MAG: ABC transporter substrate-binding protein [Cellulosilyticaceae bacterium]
MKKTLKILSSALILGMGIGLVGCTSAGPETTAAENNELRMGIMQGKSEIPVIIAEEMGYFDEVGLDVEITSFQGPNYRDAAVQAGEVDGVITDIMTVLTYTQSGFPMTMTSDMNEDFKLIAATGSGITSVKDFEGQKMVVAKNYLTHYVMDRIAQEEGITYEIEAIPQIPARLEALRNGLVGGAVLGEPQASMLTADGVTIIADAEEDYGIEIGTVAFRKEYVEAYPENMKKFYTAYNKAIDYLNTTDVKEYITVVEEYGIAPNIAPYLQTPEGKFEHAKTFDKEQFDNVLAWTKAQGVITEDFDYDTLTNFDYIK